MSQQRRATAGSKQLVCPPDVNANTTTACGDHLQAGGACDVDLSQSHRLETSLNRFGFKAPSARNAKTGVKVAAAGKSIDRPHLEGGTCGQSADYQPAATPSSKLSLAGKGDESASEQVNEVKTNVCLLPSAKVEHQGRMNGKNFFHSDESLARHRFDSLTELANVKQQPSVSSRHVVGQRNCKRVKQTDLKVAATTKTEENLSMRRDLQDQFSNVSVENSRVVATHEPPQIGVTHSKSVPKIMSGRPVAASYTSASMLKTDLSLIKQKSLVAPNKRLKMIVNYRSDSSPKALLKSTYGTRDQFGAASVKTDLLPSECDNTHQPSKDVATSCELQLHDTANGVQSAEYDCTTACSDDTSVIHDRVARHSGARYLIFCLFHICRDAIQFFVSC
jgi:hypothetical protein